MEPRHLDPELLASAIRLIQAKDFQIKIMEEQIFRDQQVMNYLYHQMMYQQAMFGSALKQKMDENEELRIQLAVHTETMQKQPQHSSRGRSYKRRVPK